MDRCRPVLDGTPLGAALRQTVLERPPDIGGKQGGDPLRSERLIEIIRRGVLEGAECRTVGKRRRVLVLQNAPGLLENLGRLVAPDGSPPRHGPPL
ncbi:MAG TPA: hypothetical protein VD978_18990 [Azospirillum sp.]|nr:hypothetical protein [Azospirillum sp.]